MLNTNALRRVVGRSRGCNVLSLLLIVLSANGCADGAEVTTESGLVYTVVEVGDGPEAQSGQLASIHETVHFTDGRLLYSTDELGQPVTFLLGGDQAIAGVDELVTGMRVGERRQATMPPHLSQRSAYPDGLSPDDTLLYDLRLVGLEPGS